MTLKTNDGANLLKEVLWKEVAPWILRILSYVGKPMTREELGQRLEQKFASQNKSAPSAALIDRDLAFLIENGLVEQVTQARLAPTPSGQELARELAPPANPRQAAAK